MKRLILVILTISWLAFPALVFADAHDPVRMTPVEVMEKMNGGEEILFLDTRNTRDWANAKRMIPGAIRIGSSEILTRVAKETPRERLIITYCT